MTAEAEELDRRAVDLYLNVCGDDGREVIIAGAERPENLYTAWDDLMAREWADRGYLSWEEVKALQGPSTKPMQPGDAKALMQSLVSMLEETLAKLEKQCPPEAQG